MGAMRGASRSATFAIDANGSVESDNVYESDAEQVSGYDTSDGDWLLSVNLCSLSLLLSVTTIKLLICI